MVASAPPEEYSRKLRCAEDLATRLQKRDWQTRANLEKLEAVIKEMLEVARRSTFFNRLRRVEALEKALGEVEQIHDLRGRDTIQRLEIIFYQVRLARQGR